VIFMAEEKKEAKKKAPPAAYKPAQKFCPKCGARLAAHEDRFSCGKCGYTEWKGQKGQ
jgi:ubiquitin-small subunit ribosomal protein S27Ae